MDNLKDMGSAIKAMPQYLELLGKYSVHLNMSQKCMDEFNRKDLITLASLEQEMATGEDAQGNEARHVMTKMTPILARSNVSTHDRMRLLMLYLISQGGMAPSDLEALLNKANLNLDDKNTVSNLFHIGVRIMSEGRKKKKAKASKGKKVQKDEDVPYELSRFVPVVKTTLENLIAGTLSPEGFPGTKGDGSNLTAAAPVVNLKKGGVAPKFAGKKPAAQPVGNRVIVFICGGMTYSEIRSVYEVSKKRNRACYIGSTHIITPATFIDELKRIKPLNTVSGPTPSSSTTTTSSAAATTASSGH